MAPRLVYDGECGFCRYTVDYARALTGNRVEYLPFQAVAHEYPSFRTEDFAHSIWLFEAGPNGPAASGADAAFRTLALGGRRGWRWGYQHVPGFARLAEWGYGWVSRHREGWLRVARPLFGQELMPARFERTADVVYRGIAACAVMAFVSLWLQAEALIGDSGVLPAGEFLEAVEATFGIGSYWPVPSVLWLGVPLHWVFAFGTLCAVVALAGKLRTSAALGAYASYLSIVGVGQVFTSFQWDMFLLECLFAAAILARSPVAGIWVLRLLAFRFLFLSGAVKLLSGDPVWADLTALEYHFETQPLPTALAWFAHHLPASVLAFAVGATFAVELVLPFLIFGPRRLRAVAAWAFIAFEVLILVTGNYNFFNLLTIVVCIALLDDRLLRLRPMPPQRLRRLGARWLAAVLIVLGLSQTAAAVAAFPNPAGWIRPLRIVNGYGLFAVMTTERRELVIEGSMDGRQWLEYEFPYKPGDLDRVPGWAAPHQPRLDWQMWFAALSRPEYDPWIYDLVFRLLHAEPAVLKWIDDPFAGEPPRYVRIISYRYTFSPPDGVSPEPGETRGEWWTRSDPRLWLEPLVRRVPRVTHDPLEVP